MLIAIRDAESRTRFLGYRVESYKLLVFTLSACMAGVAGALYVPQVVEHNWRGKAIPQFVGRDNLIGSHIDLDVPTKGIHALRQGFDHLEGGG